jgi:hypothetical protein
LIDNSSKRPFFDLVWNTYCYFYFMLVVASTEP